MPEELYTSRDFCELAEKFEELKRENEELVSDKTYLINAAMDGGDKYHYTAHDIAYRDLERKCKALEAENAAMKKDLKARIAELEAMVDELKPYRDGYDPEEVFPPEDEWVWLRDCDDNIEPVQYSHKTEWYWNYEGCWMPDDGDIRRWYPIGKLPEVQE